MYIRQAIHFKELEIHLKNIMNTLSSRSTINKQIIIINSKLYEILRNTI